jgi:hypothetical protein
VFNADGGFMDILVALKEEEAKLQQQLAGIQGAITALTGAHRPTSGGRASSGKSPQVKRVVSASLRAHLSRKAKERWARIRAEKGKGKKTK